MQSLNLFIGSALEIALLYFDIIYVDYATLAVLLFTFTFGMASLISAQFSRKLSAAIIPLCIWQVISFSISMHIC